VRMHVLTEQRSNREESVVVLSSHCTVRGNNDHSCVHD
jgi:hypothetical protein